jgi:hypothetical protein
VTFDTCKKCKIAQDSCKSLARARCKDCKDTPIRVSCILALHCALPCLGDFCEIWRHSGARRPRNGVAQILRVQTNTGALNG